MAKQHLESVLCKSGIGGRRRLGGNNFSCLGIECMQNMRPHMTRMHDMFREDVNKVMNKMAQQHLESVLCKLGIGGRRRFGDYNFSCLGIE